MTPRRLLLAAAASLATQTAVAQTLTIGIGDAVTNIDPHYLNSPTNKNVICNIYDALTDADSGYGVYPSLAESWKRLDDTTWEFKIRPGVRFHDGVTFTADDVAFTLARAPVVPNSPSSYSQYTKQIASVEVINPETIRIHTKGPAPGLLWDLMQISIIARHAADGRSTADFNAGRAAIGTGPYRFVSWQPGDRLRMTANPEYWGGVEPWANLTIRPIANDGARVAAMLAGDVDMIEGVPSSDRARLLADPKLALWETDAFRIIYIVMDSARDASPGIADAAGKPMDKNPLRDARVRRAINLAINRPALIDRLLGGQAHAAGQYVPSDNPGASPNLKPSPYDPDGAKRLLAEAGWPDGFSVTMASSNDRFPQDAQVAQAVGQMLARIGIKVNVTPMPASQLFSRGSKLEFSMMLSGWVGNGDPASPLTALMATYDPKTGMGPSNRGRWSNAGFDAALGEALQTLDEGKRNALFGRAADIAVADMGVIPVYFTINSWATRKGLKYEGRGDEMSLAMGVKPVK